MLLGARGNTPPGTTKFVKKPAALALLPISGWPLAQPAEEGRGALLDALGSARRQHRHLDGVPHQCGIRAGARVSALTITPTSMPTRSPTASCRTPFGQRTVSTICENTPPARSRRKGSRGRAPAAPDRATARHRTAIPVAPEGNIQWPPTPQILKIGHIPPVEAESNFYSHLPALREMERV